VANENDSCAAVAHWAKRCFFAGRTLIDDALRPYELGATQWFVLRELASGAVHQRDLVRRLAIERATLSVVVANLVRKGLLEQVRGEADQRRKLVRLTDAGKALWERLPDLDFIHQVAFGSEADEMLAATAGVLQRATERMADYGKGDDA
jgi:MarR family transcriptional regulator, lower aerobic nicotinate degradation pathway regulator